MQAMSDLLPELESLAVEQPPEGTAAAPGFGTLLAAWSIVQKLIVAVKNKDMNGIMVGVRDLLDLFIAKDGSEPSAMALPVGWKLKLVDLLRKIIPLVLEAV